MCNEGKRVGDMIVAIETAETDLAEANPPCPCHSSDAVSAGAGMGFVSLVPNHQCACGRRLPGHKLWALHS